jgi:PAS domain S-box-containing protein
METPSRNQRKFITIASILIVVLGLSVILGWLFDIALLKSVFPDYTAMRFNTSLGLILAGISLYLLNTDKDNIRRLFSNALAFLVLAIGGLTFSQELFNYNLGIDQLFIDGTDSTTAESSAYPGRMATMAAACFFLIGISFIGVTKKNKNYQVVSQVLLNIVSILSFTAILGYLLNVPQFYKLAFLTSMAVHTAFGFFILSIAASLVQPSLGITGLLMGTSVGSRMARILFTQLTLAVLLLSYLRILGHRQNIVSDEFGTALFAISFILISLVLIWRTSRALNLVEQSRAQTEGSLFKVSAFLNATPDPIVIVNEGGVIQLINEQTENIFGYKKEELIGQSIEILIPDRFRHAHVGHRSSFVNAPKARSMGSSMRLFASRKDGTEIPVEVSLNPVRMQNETWVAAAIRDVTEREKFQEDIKKSREQFLTFFNMNPVATIISNYNDSRIEQVNDAFLKLFSYDKSIIGKTTTEVNLVSPEDRTLLRAHLEKNQMKLRGFETKLRDGNGRIKNIIFSSEMILLDDQEYAITSILDITDRIENEAKLEEVTDRLKLATYHSSIGIWDFDVVNNVLIWDDFMFQLFGVKKENFSGAYEVWRGTLHPDDLEQSERELQMALSGEKEFDTEFRVIWPDQSVHFIRAKAMVQRDTSGTPLRMLGTNWDITNQKLAEVELQQSNQRNQIFVEQAPRAMAMFDKNMCYMAASQQWIKDYNLFGREIIGHSHYEIFPEIGEEWKKQHQECLQGAINQTDEVSFERADGTVQWLSWDVRPWYISEGNIGGLIMYTADITHLKQKDQERRRIEEILDKTNEVARIGTWEVDLKLGRVLWSRITKEIHEVPEDYKPELDTAINFFKPGESQSKIEMVVAEAIEKGISYDVEVELVTATGKIVWVRAIGQSEFADGKCKRLYGVFQDIDLIKRSEQLLNRANEELNAIFNSEAVSIIGTDTKGIVTHFNHGAEKMLQHSSSEMIGKKSAAEFHLEEEIIKRSEELSEIYGHAIHGFDVFVELARKGQYESREWTYVRKDHSTFKVLLTVTALRDEKNDIFGFLGIAIDISDRVESQRKLIEAKTNLEILTERLTSQNVQLANFAHITSHNLRSPVSNLSSLLQFYKTAEDEKDRKTIFDKFETVIHHLSSTLNSLVEALKMREEASNDLQVIEFEEVLDKTMEIVTAQIMETRAKIVSDFSKAPQIEYNHDYLESIFLNLLTNAMKYRDHGRSPEIELTTHMADGRLVLTVKDNGLGIDLDKHGHKLFGLHKTFHKNSEAKGVGLYLTKTQIETMGGTISVESEVGKGTTFMIKF